MEIIQTNIEGLTIRINKVVKDERGFLAEIAPYAEDSFLKAGIGNIYVSVAKERNVAKAGHFHKKNVENFFTISGTSLWLFVDCRNDSLTFNKFYTVILGSKNFPQADTPFYTIEDSKMAQVLVPSGVYHIFWPITDDDVTVLAIASEPYDKSDYEKIDLNNYPEIKNRLEKFEIQV